MNKKTIIVLAALAIILIAGFLFLQIRIFPSQEEKTEDPAYSDPQSFKIPSISSTAYIGDISQTTSTPAVSAVQWGAYTDGSLADLESRIGKPVNIQAVFIGWGEQDGAFPTEYSPTIAQKGKTLLIYWEPSVDYDSITSGTWDAYLRSFAASAKSYSGPIILAPFAEMNGDWDVWDGTVGNNTPQKAIAGWKYVHNFFGGIANVKFGWAVNSVSEPDTPENAIEAYYPGDAYVDYAGVDGFNFGDPWQSFSEIFDNALARIAIYRKPVYIFSIACAENSKKPAWITDALAVQIPKHPEIAGWVWFNENKERNWLIWSSTAALNAFKTALP